MRTFLLSIILIFPFSILKASDVSEWFDKESNLFLEIMNNNEGTENENYEKYKYFVSKNFAIKSIAYGLIGEKIISKSSKEEISLYLNVFNDYLIKTIYTLANTNSSSSINLKDVDIKDDIFIIKSSVSDDVSSINLYWKVIDMGTSYKIIDVIVENTSYFVTKKSEFNKILRRNMGSLAALIEEIQKI